MMTREEAIDILKESKRQNEIMRDNPSTFWASHQMADGIENAKRRIEALDVSLSALRPVSRELVEKVWRGEWDYPTCEWNLPKCPKCGCNSKDAMYGHKNNFCPRCGEAMTDKAVEMVMERVEALRDEKG